MSTRTAVTFLEYWKRTNATISYYWDCHAIEEAEVSIHVVHIVISVIIIIILKPTSTKPQAGKLG